MVQADRLGSVHTKTTKHHPTATNTTQAVIPQDSGLEESNVIEHRSPYGGKMSVSAYLAAFGKASPATYALGTGLLVTSSLFFGNIGLSLTGPLPIIRDQLGACTLSSKQKIKVWRLFFDEAAKHIIGGTCVTAALHLAAFALSDSPIPCRLSIMSALCSITVLPYTLMVIMPTNDRLIALDDKVALSELDRRKVGWLIEKWDRLHKVRFLMYGSAWALGLAAFTSSL
ncbi:hypothetical protein CORC01_06515 [Colletotrichum orchidophilum]|uniref:Uncharacterized protein n=1 Tax=Colletotrichum orchidophilum TaxID=1209926 RepID=A0A1G4B9Q5_9PEZI|nr:uncharacterized protein CORC01_06515 [Colletotrichum orchidophilum]OHE98147.1 hypothetical protein CORC01_06515 [Colletotrichum orchidophilum]